MRAGNSFARADGRPDRQRRGRSRGIAAAEDSPTADQAVQRTECGWSNSPASGPIQFSGQPPRQLPGPPSAGQQSAGSQPAGSSCPACRRQRATRRQGKADRARRFRQIKIGRQRGRFQRDHRTVPPGARHRARRIDDRLRPAADGLGLQSPRRTPGRGRSTGDGARGFPGRGFAGRHEVALRPQSRASATPRSGTIPRRSPISIRR